MVMWGTLIAIYLFLAGVAAGSYITSVLCDWFIKDKKVVKLRKAAVWLATPVLGLGLGILILDAEAGLFHPWRFLYLFNNLQYSMMSIGTLIISLFFIILLWNGWLEIKNKIVPNWVKISGLILAFGTAAYTGLLIGVTPIPIWNTPLLPILFSVSGISAGIAAAFIVGATWDKIILHYVLPLKKLHLILLLFEVVLIFSLLYVTVSRDAVAAQSVAMLLTGELALWFWGGVVVIGLLIPIIIESIELIEKQKSAPLKVDLQHFSSKDESLLKLYILEMMTLFGGFALRFVIVAAAIPINLL